MADRVIVVNNKSVIARFGARRVKVMNGKYPPFGARSVWIVNHTSMLGQVGARRIYITKSRLSKFGAEPVVIINPEILDEMGINY